MADPRVGGPGLGQRDNSLRAQMQKAKSDGRNLNLCPCGCTDEELNEHGYCKHLVGFTIDGKTVELRETDLKPEKDSHDGQLSWVPEERVGVFTDKVRPDDILIPISATSRVYRGERVLRPDPEPDVKVLARRVEYLESELANRMKAEKVAG